MVKAGNTVGTDGTPPQNHLFFEYFDVAFRHSGYSGLTHQNVKIKAKSTVHISQIFPFEYWWIFQGH